MRQLTRAYDAFALICRIHDPIADELRRRDDYLRDVTGRAASTCRDHGCIVGQLFPTFRYITRAAAYVGCTR